MEPRFLAVTALLSALTFGGVWWATAPAEGTPTKAVAVTEPAAPVSDIYYSGCREVRAAGAAPLYRGQPGYREGMDGDGDGVACEDYGARSASGGWSVGGLGGRRGRR